MKIKELQEIKNESGLSEAAGILLVIAFTLAIAFLFTNLPKHNKAKEEITEANKKAYQEEQKQIYEAKIKGDL